ncbi:CD48 antigen-like isoform X1 [Alosa pseudoharengus]|uniref:CD48 antigen-like isoform X1 n=2 Tax=Alosa pseudoharengus TaxID=34774 RepID=UPI003F8A7A37
MVCRSMRSPWTLFLVVQAVFLHHTAGSPVSVFRQTGGSVTMEFQQHQQLERESIDFIQWHFGQQKRMKYVPHKDTLTVFTHKDRVVFNKGTFSLELKNLQKNDSGLYRGEISAETEVQAEFHLFVLVSAPVLTILSQTSSSDLCNVTLTCRVRNLSLNISCSNNICWPEEEASPDSTLTLFVTDDTITCNHSNQVSWRNATRKIKTLCDQKVRVFEIGTVILLIVLCVFVLVVPAIVLVHWIKRRQKAAEADIQSEYASVQTPLPPHSVDPTVYSTVQAPNQVASAVESPYSQSAANPIYSTVQQTPQIASADHAYHTSPTSLYATVN